MREHANHVRHDTALSRLLDHWQERDDRYAVSPLPMSAEEEAALREVRRNEAMGLRDTADRAAALRVLNRWTPPRVRRALVPFLPAIARAPAHR